MDRGAIHYVESTGWSMTPFVQPGDRLVVQPATAEQLRIGDLVVFRSTDAATMVCHRLVRRTRRGAAWWLCLRGDAGNGTGEWIEAERVHGRVVAIQRGHRVVTLTDPWHRLTGYAAARCHPVLRAARRLKRGIYREIRDAETSAS